MRKAVFLHNSRAPVNTGTHGKVLCLPGYCCFVLSRSLSCGDGKLHPAAQTLFSINRSPRDWGKDHFNAFPKHFWRGFPVRSSASLGRLHKLKRRHWQDPVLVPLKSIHVLPWTITTAASGLRITNQLCFKVKSSSTPSSQQLLRASSGSWKCVPVNSGKCEDPGYSNGVKFSNMPKRWRSQKIPV